MRKIILSTLFLAGVFMVKGQAVTETVSIKDGSNNAQENWYSLANGSMGTAPNDNWDLAFQVNGLTNAGVRVNSQKGVSIYLYNGSWNTLDTTGMTFTELNNSPYTWNVGAVNSVKSNLDQFDYGWGEYAPAAHQVQGNRVFILKLNDSTYKKFKVDSLAGQGSAVYFFTLANLDGTNEAQHSIDRSIYTNKNYVYYSVLNDAVEDNEPTTLDQWDLLFTSYADSAVNPMNPSEMLMHVSAGVLSNPNIMVAQVDNVADSSTYMDWFGQSYSDTINTIGYDWKTFNMTTYQYEYAAGRVYFVQAVDGNVWKLIFLNYDSSTGEITFSKEMISAAGVQSYAKENAQVIVYPNPATSSVSLILKNMTAKSAHVAIRNIEGQIVYQHEISGDSNFEVKNIPVSNLKSGVYFVNVNTPQRRITKKLVIK